jgi:SSS family solute:Na+ symporter
MHWIDWTVVAAYVCILGIITVKARRTRLLEDFTVASRDMPRGMVFATLSATYIGPAYTLGIAGNAAERGYVWFLIAMMVPLQTVLIGRWVAPKLREFSGCHSVGHVMGEIYGPAARWVTGVLSFLFNAFVVGLIARAFGEVVSVFTGIPAEMVIIVGTLPVVFYASWGGVKTVMLTDAVQFVALAVSIPSVIFFSGYLFDFNALAARVPETHLTWHGGYSMPELTGLLITFFFGEILLPPYCVRALAARDSRQARDGFVTAGLYGFPWMLVVVTIGIIGRAALPEATGDTVFLQTMQAFLPIGLLGFVLAGIFGIIMSSQDSCLHSASVAFSIDLYQMARPRASAETLLKYSQYAVGVIGVIAVVFALMVPSLVQALMIVYTMWAPTVVAPLVIGLLWRKAPKASGVAAMAAGALGAATWEWGFGNPYGVPSLVAGLVSNQIVFWAVALSQLRKGAS